MVSPSSRGWDEIHVGIGLTCLVTCAVVLRFVTRYKRGIRPGWDDWLALAGLACIFSMFVELVLWATIGGDGYHMAQLDPQTIETFFKIFLANEFTYSVTSPVIKISIIIFYRRVFSTRQFRIATDVLIGIVTAWGVATFLSAALQCQPLAKAWDPLLPGQCFNAMQYITGISAVNIVLDFAILLLPMRMVWNLQRPWQDKLALSAVFMIGAFVCFASIYRLVMILQIDLTDMPYTTYEGVVWTFVEPCIGLVCGCLPIIRGLFPAFTTKRGTSGKRSKSPGISSGSGNGGPPNHGSHSAHINYYRMASTERNTRQDEENETVLELGDRHKGNKIQVRTTVEVCR